MYQVVNLADAVVQKITLGGHLEGTKLNSYYTKIICGRCQLCTQLEYFVKILHCFFVMLQGGKPTVNQPP